MWLVPNKTQEQVSKLATSPGLRQGKDLGGMWQWDPLGPCRQTAAAGTRKAEPKGFPVRRLNGGRTIRAHFHGFWPMQVTAKGSLRQNPTPLGHKERAGSRSCLEAHVELDTLTGEVGGVPGAISGVCFVTDPPTGCQSHAFQILPSLSGRFNVSWLCAPYMAVVHPSDSCLHIWDNCSGPSRHL